MSNYPSQLDTDAELPRIDDNLSEIGGLAINAIRAAIFAVERELGIGAAGSAGSVAARFFISINADGSLKPEAVEAAGAIVGPITNDEVDGYANIAETKLALTHSTQSLWDDIQTMAGNVNNLLSLQSNQSVDFTKHIGGKTPLTSALSGRHVVSHIDINAEPSDDRDDAFTWPGNQSPRDKEDVVRSSNLALFLLELNNDLVRHEKADGFIHTDGYADQYSHVARSITVDTSNFTIVPQTADNLQEFAEFVDQNNFAGLTNHQQNQHSNGVSRTCRGLVLSEDGYGHNIIPDTPVYVYLNETGTLNDNNIDGDDLIEFKPAADSTFYFDTLFAQVRSGQIITVNYGSVEVSHIIDSVRFTYDGSDPPNRTYIVRINGRNTMSSTTAVARIDKAKYSTEDKFGVLAVSGVNNSFNAFGSLIVSDPRGAVALGLGFCASAFDANHYNLYLAIYPDGNPKSKTINLPAIDVTGNQGKTPGSYTLETIVETTNAKLRSAGFNYRMVAFSHGGEFGIMMADAINGAAFSIRSGIRDSSGNVVAGTLIRNVVGVDGIDPLGLGPNGANVGSAEFAAAFTTINQSQAVTKIFSPLKSKNFYVNGIERDSLRQITDGYSDSFNDNYWEATLTSKNIVVGTTVQANYRVNKDLRQWDLRPGKTILVQPSLAPTHINYNDIDYGRFIIQSVTFNMCDEEVESTVIQVYSAVHAAGTPIATTSSNIPVRLYFSDDSVAFGDVHVIDAASTDNFKRHFEVYADIQGHTFTHERARIDLTSTASNFNILSVSPKLRGYASGSSRNIVLTVQNYTATNSTFKAFLSQDGVNRVGPTVTGRKGTRTRLYDETNVDYIDVFIDVTDASSTYAGVSMDIELFPSLALDQEVFLLATCQVNDSTKRVTHILDARQFGNVSENEFTTSAIDFVSATARHTMRNGVVRGFDYVSTSTNKLSFKGGLALVNGRFVELNNFDIVVPYVQNYDGGSPTSDITWAVCATSSGQPKLIAIYDSTGDQLYNPTTSTGYSVEAVKFDELFSARRKDLTTLYYVYSSVTIGPLAMALTVQDARFAPLNIGVSQTAPVATFTVIAGGDPSMTISSTFMKNEPSGVFTLDSNGTGDYTIWWKEGSIPDITSATVSQFSDVEIDRIRVFLTTSSGNPAIRIKSSLGASATDTNFVVSVLAWI